MKLADDELKNALEKVLAPLIESDEGELFLVEDKGSLVKLHLRGRFAGCPGNGLATEHILLPLLQAVRPRVKLEVSSGAILPPGSTRIQAASPSSTSSSSTTS